MSTLFLRGAVITVAATFAAIPLLASTRPPGPPPSTHASAKRPPDPIFHWTPERSPRGPVVVVISLPEQRAHVYRNGVRIGLSTVSTGRRSHPTPTGTFPILQKLVYHRSTLYDDAPMPFMQRLTWGGVALHGGALPGYPASHGCIRLPQEFARLLYEVTSSESTVVIADESSAPLELAHPGLALPPLAGEGLAEPPWARLAPGRYEWVPERAPEGPVTVLVSGDDRLVYVYRDGRLIGRAGFGLWSPDVPLEPAGAIPERVRLSRAFVQLLDSVLDAGAVVEVTPESAAPAAWLVGDEGPPGAAVFR